VMLAAGAATPAAVVVGASAMTGHHGLASPLTVFARPTPPLRVPHYRTIGTYPQVSGSGLDLRHVNAALRNSVLAEQQKFARVALKQEALAPDSIRLGYTGLFATSTVSRLLSASTVVVSALIRLDEIFPGGHDEGYWLSVTVRVPSGLPVHLSDLFRNRRRALRALAAAVRKRVVAARSCVRDSLRAERTFEKGFAPTAINYRYFALTTRGLAIGFPIGQVASDICNRVDVTVPYAALRSYLSQLGKKLIVAVRQSK